MRVDGLNLLKNSSRCMSKLRYQSEGSTEVEDEQDKK